MQGDSQAYNQANSAEEPRLAENREDTQQPAAAGVIANVSTEGVSQRNADAEESCSKTPLCYPAPPEEIKLFVGRVPRSMHEGNVRPLFEKFGDVLECIIIRDRNSGLHKGSAFVRMSSIASADAAIRELSGTAVLDSIMGPILIKYAAGEMDRLGINCSSTEEGVDRAKLFVGSLPKSISEDDIRRLFEPYGRLDEIYLMREGNGACKGCAFVKYAYKEQALYACKQLNGNATLEGCARPIEVRFAECRTQKSEVNPTPASTVNNMTAVQGYVGVDPTAGYYGQQCGIGLGAIPNNNLPRQAGPWKEYFTDKGKPYYHNEITCQTQWDMPPEFEHLNSMMTDQTNAAQSGSKMTGPAGANVFIFHIPNDWTDSHLLGSFSRFGPVLSASIAKDKTTGRNKGFGFVSYMDPVSAQAAIKAMNGYPVFGKRLKVSLKQGEEFAHIATSSSPVVAGTNGIVPLADINNGGVTPGCSYMPSNLNMMNQYAAVQGNFGQYGNGYVGNRYAPY